jgi:hypothetical protein
MTNTNGKGIKLFVQISNGMLFLNQRSVVLSGRANFGAEAESERVHHRNKRQSTHLQLQSNRQWEHKENGLVSTSKSTGRQQSAIRRQARGNGSPAPT